MANESLQEQADLIGLEADETLKVDFFPDALYQRTKFVQHRTGTRVIVWTEKTHPP